MGLRHMALFLAFPVTLTDSTVAFMTEASAACAARGDRAFSRRVVVLRGADHGKRIDQPRNRIFPHLHPAFLATIDEWLDQAVLRTSGTTRDDGGCPEYR